MVNLWKNWIDKETKLTPDLNFWVCRCNWSDYFDFRIIVDYGRGHVRVSFYPDEIIISVRFETEYRIRTAVSGEERRELSEDISGRGYVSVRGPECKIYGEKLAEIFEVVRVEK